MALGVKTGGRKKGTPNKATQTVREAIAQFAENNVERLQTWLDAIGEENPEKAADLYVKLLEYHVPKLQRTDVHGELTHLFPTDVNVNVIKPKKDA